MITFKAIYFSIALILLSVLYPSTLHPGDNKTNSPVIAFVSDTQAPMMVERIWLKSDDNEKATAAIFSSLMKEKDLSALFHLGDITPLGFLPFEWDTMNRYFSSLRKHGVQIYPETGNHEYMFFSSLGKKQFFKQFPEIKSSWYEKQVGNVAVILLNSNFSDLSEEEVTEQQKWFEKQVDALDKNPEVKAVIIGTHYSPYTNSTIVNPSEEVQKSFIPVFQRSKKCILFISGHSHALEHFKNGGKDFIVTGGGGGLLHPLRTGKEGRYKDLSPFKTPRRMFHYILCEEKNDSLIIKVKMINPDYRSFKEAYTISFPVEKH